MVIRGTETGRDKVPAQHDVIKINLEPWKKLTVHASVYGMECKKEKKAEKAYEKARRLFTGSTTLHTPKGCPGGPPSLAPPSRGAIGQARSDWPEWESAAKRDIVTFRPSSCTQHYVCGSLSIKGHFVWRWGCSAGSEENSSSKGSSRPRQTSITMKFEFWSSNRYLCRAQRSCSGVCWVDPITRLPGQQPFSKCQRDPEPNLGNHRKRRSARGKHGGRRMSQVACVMGPLQTNGSIT